MNMNRNLWVWTIFGACLLLGLGGMGALTVVSLRMDQAKAESRQQAEVEELARLALWRVDSELSTLVAEEAARPYFAYRAVYPATRAYTQMFAEIEKNRVFSLSPLAISLPPHVLLHFQIEPDGKISSPQAPEGNMRDLAERYVSHEQIEGCNTRLGELTPIIKEVKSGPMPARLESFRFEFGTCHAPIVSNIGANQNIGQNDNFGQNQTLSPQAQRSVQVASGDLELAKEKSSKEFASRSRSVQTKENYMNSAPWTSMEDNIRISATAPLWSNGRLLLVRRVMVNTNEYFQGCWLNWEWIRKQMLAQIQDLLPQANLVPVTSESAIHPEDDQGRMLAALPVRLEMGPLPPLEIPTWSPIRIALVMAWGAVALAAIASGFLLAGALALSERRGAFVSAVSHELRTPLTTFRLYSEMLADGMTRDDNQRQSYYQTLKNEAARLSHLVENVLAYARLERRAQDQSRVVEIPISDLIANIEERCHAHAERSGMNLVIEVDPEVQKGFVKTDPSTIEQAFFNLVDNACKYASKSEDCRIELCFEQDRQHLRVLVRDHGPGLSKAAAARLFRPFSKSAKAAADTVHGVGLGLALSRKLARGLGGDLRLISKTSNQQGACFALTIPMARPSSAISTPE